MWFLKYHSIFVLESLYLKKTMQPFEHELFVEKQSPFLNIASQKKKSKLMSHSTFVLTNQKSEFFSTNQNERRVRGTKRTYFFARLCAAIVSI